MLVRRLLCSECDWMGGPGSGDEFEKVWDAWEEHEPAHPHPTIPGLTTGRVIIEVQVQDPLGIPKWISAEEFMDKWISNGPGRKTTRR